MPSLCSCTTAKNTQCSFRSRKKYCGHHTQCKLAWESQNTPSNPAPNKFNSATLTDFIKIIETNPHKTVTLQKIVQIYQNIMQNENLPIFIKRLEEIMDAIRYIPWSDEGVQIFDVLDKLESICMTPYIFYRPNSTFLDDFRTFYNEDQVKPDSLKRSS